MVPLGPLQGMSLQWKLGPILGVMASWRLFLPMGGTAGPGGAGAPGSVFTALVRSLGLLS